jgi:hypothetical protein
LRHDQPRRVRIPELTPAGLAHRWRERTLQESVAESVERAGEATEYATADDACRWLLQLAWHELEEARRAAIDGKCSMRCDGVVAQIVGLTKLVGPIGWGSVSVYLVLDGIYEQIHEAVGTPTLLSDDDRARALKVKGKRQW